MTLKHLFIALAALVAAGCQSNTCSESNIECICVECDCTPENQCSDRCLDAEEPESCCSQ